MSSAGIQFIVDIFNVNEEFFTDADHLFNLFSSSLKRGGMNILGDGLRHTFPNGGSTFIFILKESHATLHSYPERRYIAIDIFVCTGKDPSLTIDKFTKVLNSDIRLKKNVLERG